MLHAEKARTQYSDEPVTSSTSSPERVEMEIRIYTIKRNPPQWVRNVILYALLPAGALSGVLWRFEQG
jgi:hypothetical protein